MIIDAGRSSMPATFNNWASVADDGAWHAIADAAKPEKLQCFAKLHDAVEEPFYPSNPSEQPANQQGASEEHVEAGEAEVAEREKKVWENCPQHKSKIWHEYQHESDNQVDTRLNDLQAKLDYVIKNASGSKS